MFFAFRKALNLVHYLLNENSSDSNIVHELGFPRIMLHLVSSSDSEVREAALRGLLELAQERRGDGASGHLVGDDREKLKQILQERIDGISVMSPEDLGAAREERHLVDSLWKACYGEPSSLNEKGLLVLPGEDAVAPDVVSKSLEHPIQPGAEKPTETEKKAAPLLLGPGPAPSVPEAALGSSNDTSDRNQ